MRRSIKAIRMDIRKRAKCMEGENRGKPGPCPEGGEGVNSKQTALELSEGLSDQDKRTLIGGSVLEGGKLNVSGVTPLEMGEHGIMTNFRHPKLEICERAIGIDREGNKFIENMNIEIKPEYQGKGLGTAIFTSQVEQASKAGFKYLRAVAEGKAGSEFNGYYTWPRLGYNQTLESLEKTKPKLTAKIRENFPNAESILDIFEEEGGSEWWKQNGRTLPDARFDLTEGSRSMNVLNAYLKAKGLR